MHQVVEQAGAPGIDSNVGRGIVPLVTDLCDESPVQGDVVVADADLIIRRIRDDKSDYLQMVAWRNPPHHSEMVRLRRSPGDARID